METLGKLSLYIHILVGVITLIAGPIAIFYQSNPRIHRLAGKVFFYAMIVVVFTSVIGFLKRPDQIFFQFLLGLSGIVAYHLIRGIRAIMIMKGSKKSGAIDRIVTQSFLFICIAMFIVGLWYWYNGSFIAFSILFCVFGVAGVQDGLRFLKVLKMENLDPRWWFQYHINSMFAAFIASTTAFAVNAATFAPWYVQWFAPTLILVPLQIYFLRKRKISRRDLGSLSQSTVLTKAS